VKKETALFESAKAVPANPRQWRFSTGEKAQGVYIKSMDQVEKGDPGPNLRVVFGGVA